MGAGEIESELVAQPQPRPQGTPGPVGGKRQVSRQLQHGLAVGAKRLGTERKERWVRWGKPGKALQEVLLELDVKENDKLLGYLGREGTVLTGHLSKNVH